MRSRCSWCSCSVLPVQMRLDRLPQLVEIFRMNTTSQSPSDPCRFGRQTHHPLHRAEKWIAWPESPTPRGRRWRRPCINAKRSSLRWRRPFCARPIRDVVPQHRDAVGFRVDSRPAEPAYHGHWQHASARHSRAPSADRLVERSAGIRPGEYGHCGSERPAERAVARDNRRIC